MKLVKIEKPNCGPCNQVGAFLDNANVSYEKWDITGDGKESDQARALLGKLGLFTAPVTVVLGEEDAILGFSRGFNPEDLEILIQNVK